MNSRNDILVLLGFAVLIAVLCLIGWPLVLLYNYIDPKHEIDTAYSILFGIGAVFVVAGAWGVCECWRQCEEAYSHAGHRHNKTSLWQALNTYPGGLALLGSLLAWLVMWGFLEKPMGYTKDSPIIQSLIPCVLGLPAAITCFWLYRFPAYAWRIVKGIGWTLYVCFCLVWGLLLILSCLPGLSAGWQQSWWKRLLDILANVVWLACVGLAIAFYVGAPWWNKPAWWAVWLTASIPVIFARGIRRAIIFVVDGPAKPAPPALPPPIAPEDSIAPMPPITIRSEDDDFPRLPPSRGGGQFLPAMD